MDAKDRRIAEQAQEIAELKALLRAALARIAELEALVASLQKNSSNSSKPPSSDIVKPPKDNERRRKKRKIGAQTLDTVLEKILPVRGMVVFGLHGDESLDKPLENSLTLYDEEHLTARDVFLATVGAELVLMGACHSGIADGSPLPGDDLFGLQRAFLHQGSRTVVSSLWQVNDDVSPFLTEGLAKRLHQGIPAARAMVESQKEYLK